MTNYHFNEEKHPKSCKNTRNITEWICLLYLGIEMGMKVCDRWRKILSSECKNHLESDHTDEVMLSTIKDDKLIDIEISIDFPKFIGESPLKREKKNDCCQVQNIIKYRKGHLRDPDFTLYLRVIWSITSTPNSVSL